MVYSFKKNRVLINEAHFQDLRFKRNFRLLLLCKTDYLPNWLITKTLFNFEVKDAIVSYYIDDIYLIKMFNKLLII